MYISNDDTKNSLFCRLQLLVNTFGHLMNQPIKSPQSSQANEQENVIKNFADSCNKQPIVPFLCGFYHLLFFLLSIQYLSNFNLLCLFTSSCVKRYKWIFNLTFSFVFHTFIGGSILKMGKQI